MTDDPNSAPIHRLINRSFMQDPYPALAALRSEGSVTPIENNGMRMWMVCRYADAAAVLVDPTIGKDVVTRNRQILARSTLRPERRPRLPLEIRRGMIDRDDPDHGRLRSLVTPAFTSAGVAKWLPAVEEWVDRGLSSLATGQPVDLVSGFARPTAAAVLSTVIGIPSDLRLKFPPWESDLLTSPDIGKVETAGRELAAFARELIERRTREPHNDLLAELVAAHGQSRLNEVELTSMMNLLLVAGMEPASAISNGLLLLVRHPEHMDALADDPGLVPKFADEVLRYESPFRTATPRVSDCPVQVGDAEIPPHEIILVSIAAANRDPERFADPDVFDMHREGTGHLGFGRGSHRCLGAVLGRLEMEVALRELTRRFRMRPATAGDTFSWRPGIFMRRLKALPVILERR